MKMLLKRFLPLALAFCMTVSLCPIDAAAADTPVYASTIVSNALSLKGLYPYVWGGESVKEGGFDCTGFVWHVMNQMSGVKIGLLTLRSKSQLATAGTKIYGISNFLPGDIIQFEYPHVALYIGDGQIIESTSTAPGTNPGIRKVTDKSQIEYAIRLSQVVQDDPEETNPRGTVDSVVGKNGKIRLRGWAFDTDNLNAQLEIQVYIGGPKGSGEAHTAMYANYSRPDVNDVFAGVGTNHGFNLSVSTNKTGYQSVYVYAVNVGRGKTVEIGHRDVYIWSADCPEGTVDEVKAGEGQVYIRGWAFDPNSPTSTLEIHAYIGQEPSAAEGHSGIYANVSRPDVNNAYPGVGNNHGYAAWVNTNRVGEQTVFVYGINLGSGENIELGRQTVFISAPAAKEIPVESISLSADANTLTYGEILPMRATVSPANATDSRITWSSSNTAVATVYDGNVRAVGTGTAVITATAGTKRATYTIKVVEVEEEQPMVEPKPSIHFQKKNTYRSGQFIDVPNSQWYTQSVASAYQFGLMKGNSATTFNPYGNVTIAEAITMAARIHSIYTTGSESFVQSGKWYQVYLDYAYKNGIISYAYYKCDVNQKATRAQFAEIFANAMPGNGLAAINNIQDNAIPDVKMTASYASSVYKLYRAGILAGGDARGTFSPGSFITRAECAAITSRMADTDNRVSFSLG